MLVRKAYIYLTSKHYLTKVVIVRFPRLVASYVLVRWASLNIGITSISCAKNVNRE